MQPLTWPAQAPDPAAEKLYAVVFTASTIVLLNRLKASARSSSPNRSRMVMVRATLKSKFVQLGRRERISRQPRSAAAGIARAGTDHASSHTAVNPAIPKCRGADQTAVGLTGSSREDSRDGPTLNCLARHLVREFGAVRWSPYRASDETISLVEIGTGVIAGPVIWVQHSIITEECAIGSRCLTVILIAGKGVIGEQFELVSYRLANGEDHGVIPGADDAVLRLDDAGCWIEAGRVERHRDCLGGRGGSSQDVVTFGQTTRRDVAVYVPRAGEARG